jgi:hypothetical protein
LLSGAFTRLYCQPATIARAVQQPFDLEAPGRETDAMQIEGRLASGAKMELSRLLRSH